MVDHQERDPFDFRRRREPDHRLAVAIGADPLEYPALLAGLAAGDKGLQETFVSFRSRGPSFLRLGDYLARIVSGIRSGLKARPDAHQHRHTHQPSSHGPPFPPFLPLIHIPTP